MLNFSSMGLATSKRNSTKGAANAAYSYPALVMSPTPTQPKQECGFHLNDAARELLGSPQAVTFSFQFLPQSFIINADTLGEDVAKVNVRGNGNFANKKLHAAMVSNLNLDSTKENVFRLENQENGNGYSAASLNLVVSDAQPVATQTCQFEEAQVVENEASAPVATTPVVEEEVW